jgi:hypothetical protein
VLAQLFDVSKLGMQVRNRRIDFDLGFETASDRRCCDAELSADGVRKRPYFEKATCIVSGGEISV